MPFGIGIENEDTDITLGNVRRVLRSTVAGPVNVNDNGILFFKVDEVAGVMANLHEYPGVAVMIPNDQQSSNTTKSPEAAVLYRFVNVYAETSIEVEQGRRKSQPMNKKLTFGNLADGVLSTVYLIFDEKLETQAKIVWTIQSNHEYDCDFNVVLKTPGMEDIAKKVTLGAPRFVNYIDNEGKSKKYWDWRFLCQGCSFAKLDNVQNVTRDSVWEIWTEIEGKDTLVFKIAFAGE